MDFSNVENEMESRNATDGLLNIQELASWLGMSVGTLYHLVSQQRLPVVRISARCIRFRRREIEGWITAHLSPVREQRRDSSHEPLR